MGEYSNEERITHHASRITHHASRITHHASRITHHASRFTFYVFPPVNQISHHMSKRFYITTAIDYTNGQPHLGHAYEKIVTDVIARARRSLGEQVFFLTGLDEHGQKVQQAAQK